MTDANHLDCGSKNEDSAATVGLPRSDADLDALPRDELLRLVKLLQCRPSAPRGHDEDAGTQIAETPTCAVAAAPPSTDVRESDGDCAAWRSAADRAHIHGTPSAKSVSSTRSSGATARTSGERRRGGATTAAAATRTAPPEPRRVAAAAAVTLSVVSSALELASGGSPLSRPSHLGARRSSIASAYRSPSGQLRSLSSFSSSTYDTVDIVSSPSDGASRRFGDTGGGSVTDCIRRWQPPRELDTAFLVEGTTAAGPWGCAAQHSQLPHVPSSRLIPSAAATALSTATEPPIADSWPVSPDAAGGWHRCTNAAVEQAAARQRRFAAALHAAAATASSSSTNENRRAPTWTMAAAAARQCPPFSCPSDPRRYRCRGGDVAESPHAAVRSPATPHFFTAPRRQPLASDGSPATPSHGRATHPVAATAAAAAPTTTTTTLAGPVQPMDPMSLREAAARRDRLTSLATTPRVYTPDVAGDAAPSSASSMHRPPALETTCLSKLRSSKTGDCYINNYRIIKTLGRGACGKVKLAFDNAECRLVAIKNVRRADTRKRIGGLTLAQQHFKAFLREVDIMKKLRHRNIVSLYEVIDDPNADKLYLVMQYVEKGVIAQVQVRAGSDCVCEPVPPAQLARYTREMLAGLQYLHRHDVVHRDIKPDNILVSSDDHAFLADFGVAEAFDTSFRQRIETMMAQSMVMDPTRTATGAPQVLGTKGTPLFIAPELWNGAKSYGKPVDMWAMGVTLYTLLVGKLPFRCPEDITNESITPVVPAEFDPEWHTLVAGLLHRNPQVRWTVEKAREHVEKHAMSLGRTAASVSVASVAAPRSPSSASTASAARVRGCRTSVAATAHLSPIAWRCRLPAESVSDCWAASHEEEGTYAATPPPPPPPPPRRASADDGHMSSRSPRLPSIGALCTPSRTHTHTPGAADAVAQLRVRVKRGTGEGVQQLPGSTPPPPPPHQQQQCTAPSTAARRLSPATAMVEDSYCTPMTLYSSCGESADVIGVTSEQDTMSSMTSGVGTSGLSPRRLHLSSSAAATAGRRWPTLRPGYRTSVHDGCAAHHHSSPGSIASVVLGCRAPPDSDMLQHACDEDARLILGRVDALRPFHAASPATPSNHTTAHACLYTLANRPPGQRMSLEDNIDRVAANTLSVTENTSRAPPTRRLPALLVAAAPSATTLSPRRTPHSTERALGSPLCIPKPQQ
ncbi:Protein kinase domain/Protein tyrosine kinase [Novymonas esmeraldas]|uniref:Protein kinase domain/Protein tyrosine kinase n=1 Tax=Novymonas esmeraldas TaxID=1808958 RepID=A0AAW0F3E7_9TRYP